ncbi:Retroviral aspartyl protease [Popillia japonica]|uniref:Retroviral aspartyl protease n=1 Tax=Popillia japonica TaxID=7064 RepID=A0AAW1I804_POPJA
MNIQSSSSLDPYVVNLIVEGKAIKFEVDSGAGVSIIERSAYDKLCNNVRLEKTAIRLRTYDGNIILPEGEILVNISHKNYNYMCRLLVVKGGKKCLLGRDLIKKLGISLELLVVKGGKKCLLGRDLIKKLGISLESTIDNLGSKVSLESLLSKYGSLFNNELGKYKDEKVWVVKLV